ncbi:MAG: ATP-binding protein [Candidatus Zixiibacteriota bacterium]
MSLRGSYIVFAVTIHVVWIVLSIGLLQINKWYFLGAEILILISLAVTLRLYRSFLKPLDLLSAGVDSIKDRDFNTTFVETGQKELDRLISVYNRMIEQLRTERLKQREQHYFLERLIAASPFGVIILDYDERVSMLNPSARDILGIATDKALGCSLADIVNRPWSELGSMKSGETIIIRARGVATYRCRKSHFLDRGFQRHFILIEELTKEFMATQKQAYEKVIRMMSHEINNSVGAVNSIMQSSLEYAKLLPNEEAEDFEQSLRVALNRNHRLGQFMSNLADVVHVPAPVRRPVDLHRLLTSVQLLMSGNGRGKTIHWNMELATEEIIINMDAAQIEQALVNITKNAIESIENEGTITIRTFADPPELVVIDDGAGIDDTTAHNLFAPFYTTKPDGQGIGLTLIREILTNHGFQFSLDTPEKNRTEFWIRFTNTADDL